MAQINLTKPGVAPVNGDLIEIRHDNGMVEKKYFYAAMQTAADQRRAEIAIALAEIDASTGTSRGLREALIDIAPAGKAKGLRDKEAVAILLRAELAGL